MRRNGKGWKGSKGRKDGGIGCQSWRPSAILVSRAAGVPVAGRPVLAPLGRPGARPEGPSPGDPRLGTLGKEWKGGKEGNGRRGKKGKGGKGT